MLLLLFMAMLPLKLINGQVSTNGTFYTSDDQVMLLSVAGNCVFECDNYPPCQTIKTYKNGIGCALVEEVEEKNYDVFSYVKKIANNPFDAPLAAAPNQCVDFYLNCTVWASSGECMKNPSWMHANCKDSCGMCPGPEDRAWYFTDGAGEYDTILAECGGALKELDPKNPIAVMSASETYQGYWVGVICPSTPDHDTCNCNSGKTPSYIRYADESEELYCQWKFYNYKGVCMI